MPRTDLSFDPRKRLLDELDRLIGQQGRIQDHLRNTDRLPDQREDWVALLEDDEVLSMLDDVNRHRAARIRAALDRLDKGTYGYSVDSGDPIDAQRLEAIPWALRTTEEAARLEQAQAVTPRPPSDATRKAEPIGHVRRGSVDDDEVTTYGGPAR